MKLAKKLAKLDDVPEALRALYVKEGEVFVRSGADTEIEIADPPPGLEKNRDDILSEYKEYKKRFEGVDPEEYRKFKEDKAKAERAALEGKGAYEEALKKQQLEFDQAKANYDKQIAQIRDQAHSQMVENLGREAFAQAGGKRLRLLLPEGGGGPIRSRVKFVETAEGSGVFSIQVLDKSGKAYVEDEKKGSAMRQLVNELKSTDDYGSAWDATGAGGSGAPGGRGAAAASGGGSGVSVNRAVFEAMQSAAQHAHIEAGGTVVD